MAIELQAKANGQAVRAFDRKELTQDADEMIVSSAPYRVRVVLKGTAPILLHRYSVESVEEKGNAAKGSKAKKEDDIESYAYRTDEGYLGLGGNMLPAAVREAGRSEPDPRSPRKSMRDLLRAIVISVDEVVPFLPVTKEWEYLSRMRAVVQTSAVTRARPALGKGWEIAWTLDIGSGEYLPPALLRKLLSNAGRFQGIGDYRPTYGRFDVVSFQIIQLED